MNAVPEVVTLAQIRAAVDALGIRFDDLHSLTLNVRSGSASHVRTDRNGRFLAAGDEIALTTSTFGVRDLTRAEKRAAARDRVRRARWTR